MKLTTGILTAAMMTGAVWAQNPNIINNVQSKMTAVEQKQTDDSNAALGLSNAPATTQATKPAAGAPAATVKPASIPGAKPVTVAQSGTSASAKPAATPMPKAAATATGSTTNNKLERVNVIHHADDIQIEIHSRETVIARASKLTSPARVLVELPATVVGTSQNKIPVDSDGVKGVRIAMNGKIPPTTSIVVDLEKAVSYELTPGPSDKFVLTLHTQAMANSAPPASAAKTSAPQIQIQMKTAAAKPAAVPPAATAKVAKPVVAPIVATAKDVKPTTAAKPAKPAAAKVAAVATPDAPRAAGVAVAANKGTANPKHVAATKIAAEEKLATPAQTSAEAAKPAPKPEEKKWAMSGKRDP